MKEDLSTRTTVLAVLPSEEDQASLRKILEDSDWTLHVVRNLREAQAALHEARTAVAISECCLPDGGSWKQLLNEIKTLASPLPLIVASRLAEDRLWAEVLNFGGHDLLALPFDATEVLHVVRTAWLSLKYRPVAKEQTPKAAASRTKTTGSTA